MKIATYSTEHATAYCAISLPTAKPTANVADMAAALGLDYQATWYRHIEDSIPFVEMSREEYCIWQSFCPTEYSGELLREYKHDLIPAPVLAHWHKHRSLFDSFSIRTTETPATDPILIGFRTGIEYGQERCYLLARWGAESPAELSFASVCRAVIKACGNPRLKSHEWYIMQEAKELLGTI